MDTFLVGWILFFIAAGFAAHRISDAIDEKDKTLRWLDYWMAIMLCGMAFLAMQIAIGG